MNKRVSSTEEPISNHFGFDADDLVRLATWTMPFGKYMGLRIIELPEEYLLWFTKREFPSGKLGELMKLSLALKIEGLDSLIKPLMSAIPNK